MTERLDQIEAILASVAQQQQQAQVELAETRQIVDSTARSVAANSDQIAANSELVAANARDNTELKQHLDSVARTAEANANATTETRMMVAAGFEATRQAFAETREGIDDAVRMVTTTSTEAQANRRRFDAWLIQAQNSRQRND